MTDRQAAGPLERARAAASRGDWTAALDGLRSLDAAGLLPDADLPTLAQVAYAAGHLDETITTWERAYAAAIAAGDDGSAATAAARVAMHLLFDTALLAPVRGWLARCERLVENRPESPAHAWLAVVRAYERLLAGDLEGARPWAMRAVEVGGRQDPAAGAIGQVAEARLRILRGDVERGVAALDEVGVAMVAGDLDPLSTGVVYCELVCALQGVAQYDLAEQWTEAMERWCQTNAIGSLHGRCRVHRAEILRLRGELDAAEVEAVAACDELRPYLRRELGWPLSELGTIRLRNGDLRGAEQALLAAHHAGWDAQPSLALLRLTMGDATGASQALRGALEQSPGIPSKERPPNTDLQRAPLLAAQVEVEIAAGHLTVARHAAAELHAIADRFESKPLVAMASMADGQVLLCAGDAVAAKARFTEAERLWAEVGAPYEAATARRELAECHRALGDESQASLDAAAARAVLGQDLPSALVAAAPPPGDRTPELPIFRCEGDHWLLDFDGTSARVRDRKGMRHLARLLADPGQEHHVLDLTARERPSTDSESEARARAVTDGDAGELLDEQAKAAYRRRLAEIDDDIDQATADGDGERAAQATVERELLLRELSRAFGLGGRGRRAGEASERARVAVTRAVRQAMARIAEVHPSLGEHLDRTVQTGTYCAYLPDPRLPPAWVVELPIGRR